MKLFRSMIESADGLPEVGPSARKLGVRPGDATTPDVLAVAPQDAVGPGQGGMSTAPGNPLGLSRHRRPASLGGIGQDPVWCIDTDDLGPDLQFRQDSASHATIEPARPMTLQEFETALAATRSRWQLHCR
jgi:hypothetical protein